VGRQNLVLGILIVFFIIGLMGCLFYFLCREKRSSSVHHYHYHRGYWYWWWCGPTYDNGYYYSSPYGYWNGGDWFCCVCISSNNTPNCNCDAHSCDGCGNVPDCGGSSNDGCDILAIALLIVVLIFVAFGIVVSIVMGFMIFNKIIKRHLHILRKKSETEVSVVKDKDNLH